MNLTLHTQILYGQVLTDLKKLLQDDDLDSAKAVLAATEHLHPLSAENIVFERYKSRYNIWNVLKASSKRTITGETIT